MRSGQGLARGALGRGAALLALALIALAGCASGSATAPGIDLGAGQLLAFIGGNGNLWMSRADGSQAHAVTTVACAPNVNCYGPPAWSPDGQTVAVFGPQVNGTGSVIYLYSRLGIQRATLTPPNAAALGAEPILWSHDSATVAFVTFTSANPPQVMMTLMRVSDGQVASTVPLPAPSGAQCGDAAPGGPFGSAVDRAINGAGGLRQTFDWAAGAGAFMVSAGPCQTQVAIVGRDGATRLLQPITKDAIPLQAAFSPNGQAIVADQLSANQDDLVIYDATGANGHSVFTETAAPQPYAARIAAPSWSADGKTLYFMRGANLWAVSASGGNARQIVAGATQGTVMKVIAAPTAAPNGSALAWVEVTYSADENLPRTALMVGGVDGAQPHLVNQGGLWPAWS